MTGETISISLPVDLEVLHRARALLRLWNAWYPFTKPVKLDVKQGDPLPLLGSKSGSFFSGGVDSWFTSMRRPDISHWIITLGFDMPLRNASAFSHHTVRLQKMAADFEKTLICCATNLRETRWREARWELISHGAMLGMIAQHLSPMFKRIFIPSSYDTATLHPWGSHPLSDPLFSSSTLEVIHEGWEFTRFNKCELICEDQRVLNTLHVCYRGQAGDGQDETNCCACQKCIRMMVTLRLLDKESKMFKPCDLGSVSRVLATGAESFFLKELIQEARDRGDIELLKALECSLSRSSGFREWMINLASRIESKHLIWRAAGPIRRLTRKGMIVR